MRLLPGLAQHPPGLSTLFLTELWERFSYYGMRALLVLYMTTAPALGGLGFTAKDASALYGTYTMCVWLATVPGGIVADKWLGARRAMWVGGAIIAAGHYCMVVHALPFFYFGLTLIAAGTGLLKPNISALVGGLYPAGDPRRDSGFSLFYMGINVGAMLAPLICGYLAQHADFQRRLAAWGFDPHASWHWGFGAAGVGMTLGLLIYAARRRTLAHVGDRVVTLRATATAPAAPLTRAEWARIGVIFLFFVFTMCFWAAYEQKGASLNLFARDLVQTRLFGWAYPSSWLQSLTPFFVICLAPLFSSLWLKLGERQPATPTKFVLGLVFIGAAYALFVPACLLTAQGRINVLWLVALYFLEVVGEMCLSPTGLSTVTKLAPPRVLGLMLGVWFLASSFGSKIAGYLGGFYTAESPATLARLYGGVAAGLLGAAVVLLILRPRVQRWMGGVR